MPTPPLTSTETIALVFLVGFAIQQLLQIFDPFVIWIIRLYRDSRTAKDFPAGMTEADFKKASMATLSFALGIATVILTNIRLLALLKVEYAGLGDILVTGLVLGTGTEAVNTVMKFIGYVKDAQKPKLELEVTIVPSTVTVKQGTTFAFQVNVKNGAGGVTWSVLHGAGGSIEPTGVYTAPQISGTFQVMALSTTDPSKHSVATVTVTA